MRHAVILAGGVGKRFWPRSRRERPKQFMALSTGRSLIAETFRRFRQVVAPEQTWVVTAGRYVDQVRAELPQVPADNVLGEPKGLNTAAAVALGATSILRRDPRAVMVVQAADHHIADVAAFRRLLRAGFGEVEAGCPVVLTGFKPVRPATGYGYIELGAAVSQRAGHSIYAVHSYEEKPPAARARRFLASGRYLWNGCVFFWKARTVMDGLERHLPEVAAPFATYAKGLDRGADPSRALHRLYRQLPTVSIEHGLVEKLEDQRVVAGDCGWEDIGTWEGLARLLRQDAAGNAVIGRHLGVDSADSIVVSSGGLVVTLGVRDLIVVRDHDVVLVLPRKREGELRELMEQIESERDLEEFL